MKKLITLSAVALTGATLGVGSTFGWWQEDSPQPKPDTNQNTKEPTPYRDVEKGPYRDVEISGPLVKFKDFSQTVNQVTEISEDPVEIIGDLPSYQTQSNRQVFVDYQQLEAPGAATAKLVDELEKEAGELEARGEKEAAQIQRKVAKRVRATIPRATLTVTPGKLTDVNKFDVRVFHAQDAGQIKDIEQKLQERQAAVKKVEDKAIRQSLEAEIQKLEATLKQIRSAPKGAYIQRMEIHGGHPVHDHRVTAGQGVRVNVPALGPIPLSVGCDGAPPAVHELNRIAESLEQQGLQEPARAVREHAERLQQQTAQAREQAEQMRQRMEQARAQAEQQRAIAERNVQQIPHHPHPTAPTNRVSPHFAPQPGPDAHSRQPGDGHHDGRHDDRGGHHPEAHPGGHGPHGGPHPGDIHNLLHQLHREISQLREEVRDLRGMLMTRENPVRSFKRTQDEERDGDKQAEGKDEVQIRVRKRTAELRDEEAKSKERKPGDDDRKVKDANDVERPKPTAKKREEGGKSKERDDEDKDDGKSKGRDDDEDVSKSEDRETEDEDGGKSEERQEQEDDDALGAQTSQTFQFFMGLMR